MPSATSVYYYKFKISNMQYNGFYSDDYLDDNDNVHKDGTGIASNFEPFNSFQITVYDPNFQTPPWLQNANVYHIMPDRFRNGDQTNDYCRAGSTTGCPKFYGGGPTNTVIHYDTWNTQMCDPRNPVFLLQQLHAVLQRRPSRRAGRARLHSVARLRHHLHESHLYGALVPPV